MVISKPAVAGIASGALLLAACIWTAAASIVFLIGTGLWRTVLTFPHALWAFWTYWPYMSQNHIVDVWIHRSAILTSLGLFMGVAAVFEKTTSKKLHHPFGWLIPVKRGATDNHGHAAWMSMREAKEVFPGPHRIYGGVVVGEAYRVDQSRVGNRPFSPSNPKTWGPGGKSPLLIDPCTEGPTHSLMFAGSGGFKTMSAVSTILHWRGSSVILDPSEELAPMLTEALERQGKRVVTISNRRPEEVGPWGINVLDWIDPIHDANAEQHVKTVVSWMWQDRKAAATDNGQFFDERARALVTCLLADLMWDRRTDVPKTLETLRSAFIGADAEARMRTILGGVREHTESRLARQLAGELEGMFHETFSGVFSTAAGATGWLSNNIYGAMVSGNAVRCADLHAGDLTIFVSIPLNTLITDPVIARVIIGALMSSIHEADGNIFGRILFMLDEAARLGKMAIIETMRDGVRKYGVTMQLLFQSVAQLEEQWGITGKRAWYDGCSWRGYAAIRDIETATEISTACGKHGVMAYSEGDSTQSGGGKGSRRSKGSNVSLHEIGRQLTFAEEITQDMRSDEMIVITGGNLRKPLRCGRAIYFRRPEMTREVRTSRFRRT